MYVIYQKKNDIIIILNLHDVAVESSLRSSGTEVYFNTFFHDVVNLSKPQAKIDF